MGRPLCRSRGGSGRREHGRRAVSQPRAGAARRRQRSIARRLAGGFDGWRGIAGGALQRREVVCRRAGVCALAAQSGSARRARDFELAQECVRGRLKRECWIWRRGRGLALAAANQVAGGRARGRLARSRIRAPVSGGRVVHAAGSVSRVVLSRGRRGGFGEGGGKEGEGTTRRWGTAAWWWCWWWRRSALAQRRRSREGGLLFQRSGTTTV